MAKSREGSVRWHGHRTWYRYFGADPASAEAPPLLVLHGGPGLPHDYLLDLAELADRGRTVVFYDQLGCGNSDQPDDPGLWTMDTFVDELAAVRDSLGLDRFHLLGHSWGGWLALEYALREPAGLAGLVLASTCASVAECEREGRRLKASLPARSRDAIDRHEADGTTDDPEYTTAYRDFSGRFTCRLDPLPGHVRHAVMRLSEQVYTTMFGKQWNITGNLRGWDVTDRLGDLDRPVLVTSGRFDEMTPDIVRPLADGIKNARWELFQNSAHTASAEEPQPYRDVLGSFLDQVDADYGLV